MVVLERIGCQLHPRRLLLLPLPQILSLGSSVDKSHLTKLPNTSVDKKALWVNKRFPCHWLANKENKPSCALTALCGGKESVGLHVGPSDCPLDSWDWDGQIQDWLGLLLGSLALRLLSFYLNPCTHDYFSSPTSRFTQFYTCPTPILQIPIAWWRQPRYLCPPPNFLSALL